MKRRTFFITLVLLLIAGILINISSTPAKRVLLSFDTELVDKPEMVSFVTTTLDQYGANATFFVTGEYAEKNPEIVKSLASKYEVACHTMTHPRLPEINESRLRWELEGCKRVVENLTNRSVEGFRAPYNLIDERTYSLLSELNYSYDASAFENLGWFYPPSTITELPTSSLGLLPLEDYPLLHYFHLGDLAYFLMREDYDEEVRFDLHPREVWQHRGAFQYLVSAFADENIRFETYGSAAKEKSTNLS